MGAASSTEPPSGAEVAVAVAAATERTGDEILLPRHALSHDVTDPSLDALRASIAWLGIPPFSFYVSEESVWDALQPSDGGMLAVRLLKGSWILARADALSQAATNEERQALALPHRQKMEMEFPEAYFTVDELKQLPRCADTGALPVGAVSHAWLRAHHPDPEGQNLQSLAETVRRAQRPHMFGHPERAENLVKHQAFPMEFGLFYDWASLFQSEKDERGATVVPRTPDEQAAFEHALCTMQLWYTHQKLFVIALSRMPDGYEDVPYGERGWPTVEQAWACLVKQTTYLSWPLLLDTGTWQGMLKRDVIVHPDELVSVLESKRFTSRRTDLPMVMRLYRETSLSVLGGVQELRFVHLGWSDEDVFKLVKVLHMCRSLRILVLGMNQIGASGASVLLTSLLAGAAPILEELHLDANKIGDEGAFAIASVIGSTPRTCIGLHHLRELILDGNSIGPEGMQAVVQACKMAPLNRRLSVSFFGD